MVAPMTPLRAQSIGDRLWAALLFLLVPYSLVTMLLGGLTQALSARRRPFLAAAGLQAACAGLLALVLEAGWCIWVARLMGGMKGFLNAMSVLNAYFITREPMTLLPEDRLVISVLVPLLQFLWVLAFAGAITALIGRVLPFPLPPRLVRRVAAPHE